VGPIRSAVPPSRLVLQLLPVVPRPPRPASPSRRQVLCSSAASCAPPSSGVRAPAASGPRACAAHALAHARPLSRRPAARARPLLAPAAAGLPWARDGRGGPRPRARGPVPPRSCESERPRASPASPRRRRAPPPQLAPQPRAGKLRRPHRYGAPPAARRWSAALSWGSSTYHAPHRAGSTPPPPLAAASPV